MNWLLKSQKFSSLNNMWIWQLLSLCGVILFHALGLNPIYRACLYINVALVMYFFIKQKNTFSFDSLKIFNPALLLLVSFFLINIIALNKLAWDKELSRLIYVIFFCVGIWLQALYNREFITQYIKEIVIGIALLYIAIQCCSILILKTHFGTLKNPHYLAQYSMLLIPIFFFFLQSENTKFKLAVFGLLACVIGLLLHTNSRPAWLSLMLTTLIMSHYQKHKLKAFSGAIIIILLLWISDIGNFSDQLSMLFNQITTEERVYIWSDIWNLQLQSTVKQWLFGHGLNGYESKFTHFGDLKLGGTATFNSPHNFLLEIVYIAGLLGFICMMTFYFILYRKLFQAFANSDEFKNLIFLMISILTMNLLFVSITVPIFSSYHLLITALVCGAFAYMQQSNRVFK
ncbi:MAG TPA: O-antigen ligase family protein [Methylotenera sp.]|nr:O-antigen ligase family protein [Methylotenera sp.]